MLHRELAQARAIFVSLVGRDYLDFRVDDGVSTSKIARCLITIGPVNDCPDFRMATNEITIGEDSRSYSYYNFITFMTKGPPNEKAQTAKYVLTADHPELFQSTQQPRINLVGWLLFTSAYNRYGTARVRIELMDSGGTESGGCPGGCNMSDPQFLTINITNINDPPWIRDYYYQTSKSVLEDNPVFYQYQIGDLENTNSAELQFTVISTNQALIPNSNIVVMVSNDWRLVRATPLADANGRILVVFTVSDGTNSASKTSTLFVKAVNDPPSFGRALTNITISSRFGYIETNLVAWVSKGPTNEIQTVTYPFINNNPEYFGTPGTPPRIYPTGKLTFKPKPNMTGVATLDISVKDSGGRDNGGWDTFGPLRLTITITP